MIPIRRTIRRDELKLMVHLSDSTIFAMEKRGEFSSRFALSPRCVVWDFDEVQNWLKARKEAAGQATHKPDVRLRKVNPVCATR